MHRGLAQAERAEDLSLQLLVHGCRASAAQNVAEEDEVRVREGPARAGGEGRRAQERVIRTFLTLEATRSQYVDGVADPTSVNPDLWELDQRYLELPGRDQVMLDLLYEYQSNVALYPAWQDYLRTHTPPSLLPWGRNDAFFPPAGARAYLRDLPDAELHLLDTGHFATATHSAEIAELIAAFLNSHVIASAAA